jgi:hypothetical protein
LPLGCTLQITGTDSLALAKSSSESSRPSRRAMAIRWISELVEPDSAMSAITALRKLARVTTSLGRRSSQTISTMRRPQLEAICEWRASTAGIELAPGRVRPSTSARLVMVEAVPMVLQVPGEREVPSPKARQVFSSILPARKSASAFQVLEPVPSIQLSRKVPSQHGAGRHEDRGDVHRGRAHDQAGRGLVAAAEQHDAVDRV